MGEELEERQNDLFDRVNPRPGLDWLRLPRRFVVNALADAVAYQKTAEETGKEETSIYGLVHKLIGEKLHQLAETAGHDAPLVIVAHSLGCHMISNYIWDAGHGRRPWVLDGDSALETFRTLTAIFTFGCNIPLFLLANRRYIPIEFPRDVSAAFGDKDVSHVTRWTNFYDPDDVLGFPLRNLSPEYGRAVHEDRRVNAGGFWSWTPASHTGYWKDGDVIKPIAKRIEEILELLK